MSAILVVDTEYTEHNELLEIAVVDLSGRCLYHRFFRPAKHDSWPESEKIHHITPAMVANKPTARECAKEIRQLLYSAECLAFFSPHGDLYVLRSIGILPRNVIDIRDGLPNRLRDCGLEEVASWFCYKWQGARHSALGDARAAAYCYMVLVDSLIERKLHKGDKKLLELKIEMNLASMKYYIYCQNTEQLLDKL